MCLDTICPICGKSAESTLHALWHCSSLKEVRRSCVLVAGNSSLDSAPFLDFVIACSAQLGSNDFEILCVTWWRVWHRRNVALQKNTLLPASDICDWALGFFNDFRGANEKGSSSISVEAVKLSTWQPPLTGFIKINTDAVLNSRLNLTGLGVVARDCYGRVLASFCRNVRASYQPQIAEALAILECLRLAINRNFSHIIVESDALVVVQLISQKDPPLSEVGVVVTNILELAEHFTAVSFLFVPRLLNRVAHGIAKLALNHGGESLWLDDCPLAVESLVLGDAPVSL